MKNRTEFFYFLPSLDLKRLEYYTIVKILRYVPFIKMVPYLRACIFNMTIFCKRVIRWQSLILIANVSFESGQWLRNIIRIDNTTSFVIRCSFTIYFQLKPPLILLKGSNFALSPSCEWWCLFLALNQWSTSLDVCYHNLNYLLANWIWLLININLY